MKKKKQQQTKKKEALALGRAEVIMKVRAGLMTATEAAKKLGVSRKTYYKWEQRGLAALIEGLQDQPSGRPEEEKAGDRETELERQLKEQQEQNDLLLKKMELNKLLYELKLTPADDRDKKK